jgi:hypothetical protein
MFIFVVRNMKIKDMVASITTIEFVTEEEGEIPQVKKLMVERTLQQGML